jgi:hypothetical protein
VSSSESLDERGAPYPPFVKNDDQRRRWDEATSIALKVSAANELNGPKDTQFVFYMTRHIYENPIYTTASLEEQAEMIRDAQKLGLIGDQAPPPESPG